MDLRPVILVLGEEIPPCTGGVAQWGYWMARKFHERGLRVVYAARADYAQPQEYYGDAFTVLPIHAKDWRHRKDLSILTALRRAWKRWHPKAVVCLNCKVARIPLLMRPFTGWSVAVVAHGMEITKRGEVPRRRMGLRWAFGSADLTVAVSRHTRDRVIRLGVDPGKVRVIPCGVDPDLFRPCDGGPMRRRLGLEGRPVVLTLARLVRRKGHDLVIRALAEVRRLIPDVTYVVVGTGTEAYVASLRRIAAECGVGDAVRFLGRADEADLPGLYAASDVYVMTSRSLDGDSNYEGFGITYLEANACGIPVIGADSGGVADAIIDGQTGYLVPPDDVPALTDRLLRILGQPDLRRRLGENGRARVVREMNWERVAALFLDALQEKAGFPATGERLAPGEDVSAARIHSGRAPARISPPS